MEVKRISDADGIAVYAVDVSGDKFNQRWNGQNDEESIAAGAAWRAMRGAINSPVRSADAFAVAVFAGGSPTYCSIAWDAGAWCIDGDVGISGDFGAAMAAAAERAKERARTSIAAERERERAAAAKAKAARELAAFFADETDN